MAISTTALTRDLLLISVFDVNLSPAQHRFSSISISGDDIAQLMRRHKRTIRELAGATSIPMTRIRQWRNKGLAGFPAVEAIFHITGRWIA